MITFLSIGMINVLADESDLASVISTSGNVDVTGIENAANFPWVVDGDSIINNGITSSYTTASFTVHFSSEEPMVLSYSWFNGGSDYDQLSIYVDGNTSAYSNINGKTGGDTKGGYTHYFAAGEHQIRFSFYRYYSSYNGINNTCAIKNFKIFTPESQYMNIDLSAPGTLGIEALSLVSTLPQMRYLRLSGKMNSDDWNTIRQMTGLVALDMTNADVTDIPVSAFTSNSFRFYEFPKTLKTIGEKAFYDRYLLGKIDLPDQLESIGNSAFYRNNISEVLVPSSVKSIGTNVFEDNSSLLKVTLGGGFSTLPSRTFYNCTNLQVVNGCESLKSIGTSAFNNCKYLREVNGMQPITVGDYSFYYCYRLKTIDLSKTTTIGVSAFTQCDSLKTVDLSSLVSFNSSGSCFSYCDELQSVVLPDRVTSVPGYTFYYCPSLRTVTLGASISSIGDRAFYNDGANVTKLYCNAPTPPSISGTPFYSPAGIKLYVPEYAMVSYKLNDYWSKFVTVEVNPNSVENLTLSGELELTSNVRIPDVPSVVMNRGSSLIVNGNNAQELGNFVTYHSTSTTASVISRCNAMSSTSSEARFWLASSSYWYFICPPFDVNVSDIKTSNGAQLAIRRYDGQLRADNGSGASWVNVELDATLKAGQGYIFCSSTGCYVYLPATEETHNQIFNSEAVTTPLVEYATEVSSNKSWNLVGNPYACFYDIYYMDFTAPITVWNTDNKTYSAYSIADDNFALQPLQAFFVQKPDLVNDIVFQPDGRQINSTIEHASPAKAVGVRSSVRQVVNLVLTDGETADVTRIVQNPQASDDFECETDAAKMLSYEGTAQLYSTRDGEQYAINEGKQASGTVDLGMWIPASGEYTLDVTRADADVELLDNGEPVSVPYTFYAAGEGDYEGRFAIRFLSDATGVKGIEDSVNDSAVYDLQGRRLGDARTRLQKGIYIQHGRKVVK